MSKFVLGQYVEKDTYIHHLDARTKLFCLIVLMVTTFLPFNTYPMTFIVLGGIFLFVLYLCLVARISFLSLFSQLKSMWFLVLWILILNCLIPSGNYVDVAFSIGGLKVYWEAIFLSLKVVLRLIIILQLTTILSSTTKPLDLTNALEWYLYPLKFIKFPVHEVSMIISIALRFIPTLLEELDRIKRAQESRGIDFKHGKISKRLKAIVSLIVPMFVSAFTRSEELANAMEARGYDPKMKRTKYHVLKFSISDLASALVISGVLAGIIILSCNNITAENPLFLPTFILIVVATFTFFLVYSMIHCNRIKK